jgi:hypothetical protein
MRPRKIDISERRLPQNCSTVVAIPARNEEDRVSRCLAALALQRDTFGAPIDPGKFEVARQLAAGLPFCLEILLEVQLSHNATAGGARRRAMDEGADRLRKGAGGGVLMTSDADSVVKPT